MAHNYTTQGDSVSNSLSFLFFVRFRLVLLGNRHHCSYYSPDIMDDSYRFSSSGIYRSPEEGSLQSVRQYVEDLPLTEGPEVFGMHSNADINFQLQETNKLFDTILSIQPRLQVC